MKDAGEYIDMLHTLWSERDLGAEPLRPGKDIFEYDEEADRPQSRGHVLARVTFPNHPRAYLQVDEWVRVEGNHLHRESYNYDLIVDGARLWGSHRHREANGGGDPGHGQPHEHRGDERHITNRSVSHKEALDTALDVLWTEVPMRGGLEP